MKRALTASFALAVLAASCFLSLTASASGPDAKDRSKAPATVTFSKDVAPIFFKNCVQCHRPGDIAPMSLMSYKEARPWARSIKEAILRGEMPPWHADPNHGQFLNDRRLSKSEIETIVAWVDQGAAEGNPKDMPKAPEFPDGWNIGKPDAVFHLPKAHAVPAEGVVEYKYFTVPTNFTEDRWVQAAEIRPGERNVVHHIIVFVQKGGERKLLVGYAPGEQPAVMPRGLAKKIPAGSNLVFQVHYTPNGKAANDRSYVGLIFAREPPRNELLTRPILNARFAIPPGHPNFEVTSSFTFTEDGEIHSLMPHMHLRGKDFLYRATFPDGRTRILLSVPKYDFAWQAYYTLKEPVRAPKGTRVDCIAHFDNSPGNRFNPDPTKEVRWGDQTWEEMMIGWMTYTLDKNAVRPEAAVGQKQE